MRHPVPSIDPQDEATFWRDVSLHEISAVAGDVEAMLQLGTMYESIGEERLAEAWLTKAASVSQSEPAVDDAPQKNPRPPIPVDQRDGYVNSDLTRAIAKQVVEQLVGQGVHIVHPSEVPVIPSKYSDPVESSEGKVLYNNKGLPLLYGTARVKPTKAVIKSFKPIKTGKAKPTRIRWPNT